MAVIKASASILGAALIFGLIANAAGGARIAAAQQQQQQQQHQTRTAFTGDTLYKTYCAMCHGTGGKGDGSFASSLRKRPPDLTQLTKRNDGKFPEEKVTKTIDGRDLGPEHARGDMPVWGDAFSKTQEDSDQDSVRLKIEALVQAIQKMQERPL
jgi:mono/diheme cytochrome c family protein